MKNRWDGKISDARQNWKQSFTWLYEQAAKEGGGEGQGTFLFPLTIHPQSSGKPHLLAMHERLVHLSRLLGRCVADVVAGVLFANAGT